MSLSLLAKIGELVVAIDATQIFQIHLTADLPARQLDSNLFELELGQQSIPGWDLGVLFSYGPCASAWVVIDAHLDGAMRRFGLRVGTCLTVRRLPATKRLPTGLYRARAGAIAAAFSTDGIAELAEIPSGIVLDLARLLSPEELASGLRVVSKHGGPPS